MSLTHLTVFTIYNAKFSGHFVVEAIACTTGRLDKSIWNEGECRLENQELKLNEASNLREVVREYAVVSSHNTN